MFLTISLCYKLQGVDCSKEPTSSSKNITLDSFIIRGEMTHILSVNPFYSVLILVAKSTYISYQFILFQLPVESTEPQLAHSVPVVIEDNEKPITMSHIQNILMKMDAKLDKLTCPQNTLASPGTVCDISISENSVTNNI